MNDSTVETKSPSAAHEVPPTSPSSRRRFIQQAGLATGILATGLPAVHASEESIIRVGLIGCGGRGTGAAVNAMAADPNVRIVALADLFDASMQRCRKALSGKFSDQMLVTDERCYDGFDGYLELLASDVDVVLLAAPPHYRPDHMEASVAAGKEIFCEKPVATDPTGVRRVEVACQTAREKGLNVVSGLCWRYDKGLQETMDRVQDGAIGKVVSSQCNYFTNPLWSRPRRPDMSEMEYQCNNWYNFTWLSGDHIVEQFVHSLDKAMWLHGDEPPARAYGMGGRELRSDLLNGDIYDHFSIVYEWADGSRAFASTRQMRGCFNQTEDFIFGSEGTARLIKHEIEGSTPWKFTGDKVQMHQAEQDEFFKAVRGERDRIDNGDYMCQSTLMAILGREACYTGKVLTYEEVANSPQDLRPEAYQWGEGPAVEVPRPGVYKFPTA